jgi:hypothetical protein
MDQEEASIELCFVDGSCVIGVHDFKSLRDIDRQIEEDCEPHRSYLHVCGRHATAARELTHFVSFLNGLLLVRKLPLFFSIRSVDGKESSLATLRFNFWRRSIFDSPGNGGATARFFFDLTHTYPSCAKIFQWKLTCYCSVRCRLARAFLSLSVYFQSLSNG